MGAVPVAEMLKAADCPATILALPGWVEIVGAAGVIGGVEPLPVPLSAIEITVPLASVNFNVPE
jgi:hypothetical protein